MATKLFLRGDSALASTDKADTHRGTNSAGLDGNAKTWRPVYLSTSAGASVKTGIENTVAGPTNGIEIANAAAAPKLEFISPPVSADVTISGTITANIWASEVNMADNVAINVAIDIIRAASITSGANDIVNIVNSTRTTEVAQTTRAVNNFTTGMTSGAYAGQTVNRGDRLRIRVFGDDAGTMGAGGSFTVSWNGGTGGADGDTFVSFTENFSFESAPSGSTIYLTDTVSDVSTASIDREAWTSRGGGVVNDVTNTTAGWTAPIQITDTAGGTVVDWFTKQLTAFTLGGMAQANIRALESAANTFTSLKLEISRVDSDGTNPTIWAFWCSSPKDSAAGDAELATSERAETVWCSGDDLAVSDGQRLRIRLHIDDLPDAAMVTGRTATVFYNGTSAAASGDSYVILPQTVTEFVAGGVIDQELIVLQAVNRASVY